MEHKSRKHNQLDAAIIPNIFHRPTKLLESPNLRCLHRPLPRYPVLVKARALFPALFFVLLLAGCHQHSATAAATTQDLVEQRTQRDLQREQLDLIPPPSKNRYMTIRTFDTWQNPYITVQANMVTLHVLQADANTSDFGAGGILRPTGARRQELNLSLDKLGEAMAAIPQTSWPYGRVIAIEEAHKTPASAEPAVRRTMESTVSTLSDLGIAVYDIGEGKLQ